ncbi:hypothetical protein PTKIN_Ptkin13bG0089700 [Pterospermum kingtungense]
MTKRLQVVAMCPWLSVQLDVNISGDCFFIVLFSSSKCNAQNATTDQPSEVRALNSIFQKWGTQAGDSWNMSGEPCTGNALSPSDSVFDDGANNPAMRCDFAFNNNTLCHITRLRVYALDKRGEIPEELLGLPYLTFLKIDQNFFSGPLPSFIGNMSRLQSLPIAYNTFSGSIPKELGNLTELYPLSIGNNNFSGTLPPELGNLVNLEQLRMKIITTSVYEFHGYINSCGLSGEIPSTFANLEKLQILGASDAAFTGKIPDFIGNYWIKLTSLRFEGNSLEGPIPSNFANLTSLMSLRIIGIYNGSSSLDFARNLKNLTDLVLRDVLLTGSIPSYISELQSLQKLDLSFNNLTGRIPSALFNMNSLADLFLGNNSLSGTLPSQKSETLRTIDVSYNLLSGNLPSWINSDLKLNFVANNFTLNSSDLRLLPGLQCLQRSFPCNRNPPLYANFSIKCGGPRMISNGIECDAENTTMSAATFNVTNTKKWAVSNVGLFAERQNQDYEQNTLVQVRSTNTPELYQTSRLSPGSLDTMGTRQLRDFDISKAAGGVEKAIIKNFTANVTENHLEIHLFWAGKGTCCVPEQGYYGPSISAINVVPNFRPTVRGIPLVTPKEKNHTALIVGIVIPVAVVALILTLGIIYVKTRKEDDDEEVLLGIGPRPNTFSYSELKGATEDFSPSNKLGEGGFGPVYKGTLSDGRVVAVKQLSVASNQGKNKFVAEIAIISAVQHRNLVKLYGCCIEGNRCLLVYEYLENKSLDQALFGRNDLHLDWATRFNICLSTAKGLTYLHEESRPRIVHRDVKASNILLDAELCPKISDFGLAKLYDDKKTSPLELLEPLATWHRSMQCVVISLRKMMFLALVLLLWRFSVADQTLAIA